MLSTMNLSISAMDAFGLGMEVSAHNIANINTPYFKAGRAYFESGPNGFGTRVGELSRDESPGPLIPALPADTVNITSETYALREGSNVSLEREFTGMVMLEHGYAANAQVVRSVDDMSGVIINMKV
ncbi:hypothetical protein LJC36_03710 [Desulfovibrio sp. OttesenSCG-928-C14]|nr:hypothetical protein [Desulfovibrio sp. OttesenSCG-928-C14]